MLVALRAVLGYGWASLAHASCAVLRYGWAWLAHASCAVLGYPRAIARSLVLRRVGVLPGWPAAVYPAMLLLAGMLPFEVIRPVVITPWLSLTDDKVLLLLVLAAWLLSGARAWPGASEWRALAPTLTLMAVGLVAALLAPEFGDEALKFQWRLAAGALVLLIMLRLADDPHQLRGVIWAVVIGAGISALLGIGEALRIPALQSTLSLFKVAPTRVGGELRVGASFQYATIAAMYFEMVAPLAIVLSATASRRWTRVLAVAVAGLCTVNVVLSLTRAGILTLALVGILLVVCGWLRADLRRLVGPALVMLGLLVAGGGYLAVRNPVFDMRLVSESDADWYGAAYAAPPSLRLIAGQTARVGVDVTNAGRIGWSATAAHPFALGYRWLAADGQSVLDVTAGQVPLPRDVAPGEVIHLEPLVDVPDLPAGHYRLDWGMFQQDVLQFYERGWADAETQVDVAPPPGGSVAALPATRPRDDDQAPWVVGRLDLWGAALRLIETRPLIGYGPDNFRHLYGAQLGLESWDERVQANNLYLELLADTGILGLAAFAWMVLLPLARVVRNMRAPASVRSEIVLGAGLGLLAFLVHGLLDSFLAFTPTAVLLWLLLGAIVGGDQKPQVSGR